MVRYAHWRQERHRLDEIEVGGLAKRLCVCLIALCLLGVLVLCLGS
jgi:hypothetical protein